MKPPTRGNVCIMEKEEINSQSMFSIPPVHFDSNKVNDLTYQCEISAETA